MSLRPLWLGVAGLVGFGALLELVPRLGVVDDRFLPPTSRILSVLAEQAGAGPLWSAVGNTVLTWAIGLALAVAAAVVLGVVIGSVRFLRAATASTIEFLRPIPSVAWIPAALVLYGPVRAGTLLIVVYAAFWQMLVQVLHGVADVDPVARDTAYSYRLGRWARVRWLTWPTALPYAVTGLRLAATVALILTVTGELFIGGPGLGAEILRASAGGAVPLTYALVLVTGLLGVAANLLFRLVERRALAWHPAVRGEVPA
ncbi:MAG: ABC transporter permease subunit [Micromonosporaceae bacterium]|nr:ABC transporter permease subunit [Micromonosporaceae bacterium]